MNSQKLTTTNPGNIWPSEEYHAKLAQVCAAEADNCCRMLSVDKIAADKILAEGLNYFILMELGTAGNA